MIRTVVNPYRMFSLSKFSFFTPLHLLIRSYQIPVFFICPLALSGVKSIFCSYFIGCILITLVDWFQWRQIVQYVSNQGRILFEIDGKPRSDKLSREFRATHLHIIIELQWLLLLLYMYALLETLGDCVKGKWPARGSVILFQIIMTW